MVMFEFAALEHSTRATVVSSSPTDVSLVIEAQAGSSKAMALLVRRNTARVRAFALSRLRSGDDVDDLVQETFLHATQAIGHLRSPSSFRSWLFSIAAARAARWVRQKRALQQSILIDTDADSTIIENLVASTMSPEVSVDARTIGQAIARLEAESREALLLRYCCGLRLPEIAEEMRLSLATVKRRLTRARRLLRRFEPASRQGSCLAGRPRAARDARCPPA
jgi:RNA polymerase sigma-70 factor (ECF subfamily)